jgi:hypothetical protein
VRWSAWALCGCSLALSAGAVVLAGVNGVPPAAYVNSHQATGLAFAASFPVLGAMIVGRRPRNGFGWILVVNGIFLGTFCFTQQYAPWRSASPPAAGRCPAGRWRAGSRPGPTCPASR